ncbi:MAG: SGNH/GDSL hydrolase family protein [Actinomycetota bacterium]|nr:SGNH/GDSL hydrolase family protein [Actinomycetota bacterium]
MLLFPRLSRVIALALSPVLRRQGEQMRTSIPWLPPAKLPWRGTVEGPNPHRLLVLGDSTAAGVGVKSAAHGLGGNLARVLAEHTGRGVHWLALGQAGATSNDLRRRFLPKAVEEEYDVVFLSIGANDILAFRSRAEFRADFRAILTALRRRSPQARIVVANLPVFAWFTVIPNPLRWALGLHARNLEDAAHREVGRDPGAHMSPPPPDYSAGFFARDRFHPSEDGYRDWADFALGKAAHLWP